MLEQLWLMECRRVRQYQITGSAIGAFSFFAAVAVLWAFPGLDWTLILLALLCGTGFAAVRVCRNWTQFHHAKSAYWLGKLKFADQDLAAGKEYLSKGAMPYTLSQLWMVLLGSLTVVSVVVLLARVIYWANQS